MRAIGGRQARYVTGRGEFIGTTKEDGTDAEQRADARRVYEAVISGRSGGGGGRNRTASWDRVRNRWRSALKDQALRFARGGFYYPTKDQVGLRDHLIFGRDHLLPFADRYNPNQARVPAGNRLGDVMIIDDQDVRQLPIEERKERLAVLCGRRKTSGIRLSEHLEGDGPTIFEHVCRMGLEGIVSKRIGSRYKSGRCAAWIKTKNPQAAAVLRVVEGGW